MEFNIWENPELATEDERKLFSMVSAMYGVGDYQDYNGKARAYGYVPDFTEKDYRGTVKSRPPVAVLPTSLSLDDYITVVEKDDFIHSTRRNETPLYLISGALDVYENAANAESDGAPFIDDMYKLMEKVMNDRGADKLGIYDGQRFHYDFEYNGDVISYDRVIGSFGSEELLALRDEGTRAKIKESMNNTVLPNEKFEEPESIARLRKNYDEELTASDILEKLDNNKQLDDFKTYLQDWEKKVDDFWNIDNVQYFSYSFWDEHLHDVKQNMDNFKAIKTWQAEIGRFEERKKDKMMEQAAQQAPVKNDEPVNTATEDIAVAPSGAAAVTVVLPPEFVGYMEAMMKTISAQNETISAQNEAILALNKKVDCVLEQLAAKDSPAQKKEEQKTLYEYMEDPIFKMKWEQENQR